MDAEMKPCCMCVLSFVCYEGGRPPQCPTSPLSVRKWIVQPLTTRREHTVILKTSNERHFPKKELQESLKPLRVCELVCVGVCAPFIHRPRFSYCRSGSCMQCAIFITWHTL